MPELTPSERLLLDFENTHPRHTGAKEEHIRVHFKITSARYYQLVYRMLARPEVIEEYPQLANRTVRVLGQRRGVRAEVSRLRRSA